MKFNLKILPIMLTRKTISWVVFLFISLLVSFSLNAGPPQGEISLSVSSLNFSESGGNASVILTSNGMAPWTVSSTPSWISVSPNTNYPFNCPPSGCQETITITCTSNSGCERTGLIQIEDKQITVTQAGSGSISLSPATLSYTSAASSQSVSLTTSCSGISWSVQSFPSWVTVSPSSGSDFQTLTVECTENIDTSSRSGTIDFGDGKTISISQQCPSPDIGEITGPSAVCYRGGYTTYSVNNISGITYAWNLNPEPPDAFIVSGQGTSTIEIAANIDIQGPPDFYNLSVLASTSCGESTIKHFTITSTADDLVINSHPGDQTQCIGAETNLSVSAIGTELQYQWEYKDAGSAEWLPSNNTGNNTSTLTFQANTDARQYRCKVYNYCEENYSNAATITVREPISISSTLTDKEICEGDSHNFVITATGFEPQYQWFKDGTTDLNNNSSTLSLSPASLTDAGTYHCVVSNTCSSEISNTANLTVYPAVSINVDPSEESLLPFESIDLTATGADSYVWSPATGLSSTTGAMVEASLRKTTTYSVTGTTNICSDTKTVTLTLIELMQGEINLSGTDLTASVTGGDSPYTYLWSTGAITENISVSTPGIYTVTVTDERGEEIDFAYNYSGSATTSNSQESIYTKNWNQLKVFDEEGNLIKESCSFSNYLGKLLQTQRKNFTDNKTMVTQIIYDAMGRPTVTTLAAPVDNTNFAYKKGFVVNENGDDYSYLDFDGIDGSKLNEPDPVSNGVPNTLGSYYSENNYEEPYVPATNYPYSRVEYSKFSGGIRSNSMPGDYHKMGGHTTKCIKMPATDNELKIFEANIPDIKYHGLTKVISVDVDGKETIVYFCPKGNMVAKCLGNGDIQRQIESFVSMESGMSSFVDIHIPIGCSSNIITSGTVIKIINLLNDKVIPQITQPGFYRIVGEGNISVKHFINYYNYAINVYDKMGRLKKSYSPKSIEEKLFDDLVTTYKYNSLGSLLELTSPDAGTTCFVYRKDGRIRFSQNELQRAKGKFSYTNYDKFERMREVGEYTKDNCINCTVFETYDEYEDSQNEHSVHRILDRIYDESNSWEDGIGDINCSYQTFYNYDLPDEDFVLSGYEQKYLLGRVSKTWNENSTTWYSYSYDGRIEWVVKEIHIPDEVGFGLTTIDYEYDVIGNLRKVIYQKNSFEERFDHEYFYDADNRLNKLITHEYDSVGFIKNTQLQAKYFYYQHGPLKRIELADGSQGIDYVYNINGWLKSINHPNLTGGDDPGRDGQAYSKVPEDIFGMSLDYYSGDYTRTGTNITSSGDIYNGNIYAQRWQTRSDEVPQLPTGSTQWAFQYSYNKQNWLKEALFGTIGEDGTNFIIDPAGAYKVDNLTYDANGNLKSLDRNAITQTIEGTSSVLEMDRFQYEYYGGNTTNRLSQIIDTGLESDLEDIKEGQVADNYVYNEIGQMTENKQEGHYFEYDVYGKVTAVYEDEAHELPLAYYDYNEGGFRIKKSDVKNNKETWYVRGGGSILSIYESEAGAPVEQKELPVYASTRVGVAYKNSNGIEKFNYELTDHLGNVRATFQNRVTELETYITKSSLLTENLFLEAGESIEFVPGFDSDGFEFDASIEPPIAIGDPPKLVQYSDYYPFGMVMPGRNSKSNNYRFGYQGQFAEEDPETGYTQFEARLLDKRVGRWLTTDPARQYYSPYISMGNNPINYLDPDGEWNIGQKLLNLITKGKWKTNNQIRDENFNLQACLDSGDELIGEVVCLGRNTASKVRRITKVMRFLNRKFGPKSGFTFVRTDVNGIGPAISIFKDGIWLGYLNVEDVAAVASATGKFGGRPKAQIAAAEYMVKITEYEAEAAKLIKEVEEFLNEEIEPPDGITNSDLSYWERVHDRGIGCGYKEITIQGKDSVGVYQKSSGEIKVTGSDYTNKKHILYGTKKIYPNQE